uniref:Uncharacterized protein n=1 Tax=Parascaris equorum TaxID=6256 RepID=A0A914S829_PAREQ
MPTSEEHSEDDEIRIWEDDYRRHQVVTQSTATSDRPVDTVKFIAEEDEEEGAVPPVARRTTRTSSRQRASPVDPSSEPVYNTLPRRSTRQH